MKPFPADFLWAAATAAFQVEGGADADGRGPSIWDEYVGVPGRVLDGSTADVAADSYRRYAEDVRLLKELGVRAYRFSIAWPRVLPDGDGPLNPPGADYYHRLIDLLLENGIEPWITLYHWDLPLPLHRRGGWTSREIIPVFAAYAERMVALYGDRVSHWMPFNEIHAFVDQGYGGTTKAPGLNLPHDQVAQVYHHVLLAQGAAVQAMRARQSGLLIGPAENPRTAVPAIADEAHIAAASRAWEADVGFLFGPMFHGRYPEGYALPPDVRPGDMESIRQPLDFVGMNLYTGSLVAPSAEPPYFVRLPMPPTHFASAAEGWVRFLPEAVYWAARFSAQKYGPLPVYLTENGYPTLEAIPAEEDACDLTRITYLRSYLVALQRAIEDGYPVKGYFLWSLMDSFEWIKGFASRFGIYRLDRATGERIPRLSARWYREVIRQNAVV